MAGHQGERSKEEALASDGTLNRTANKVRDLKFQEDGFFDPRDVVQVKYEMLRRVRVENVPVKAAVADAGVSRPTYYQARMNFDEAGIAGLVPRKRGPRGPHKLDDNILAFIDRHVVPGGPIRARELAKLVSEEFGVDLHPRTIERALARKKNLPT